MLVLLLFGTHLYFTVRLGVIQRKLPLGIWLSFTKDSSEILTENEVSPYSALATALAATIGTGNIIGISAAIAIGGPGAVFWCWLTGFLGVATCYAESFLAVRYKVRDANGRSAGGPMYVLEHRLGKKWLAVLFSVFTVLASFGMGSSVQAYSIRAAAEELVSVSPHLVGIMTAVLAGVIMIGGRQTIAKVCTWLVPFMSILYLGGCLWLIVKNKELLPQTVAVIFRTAFCGEAAVGGAAGGAVMTAVRVGVARGLFTNEAGLGSIPMAAASSGSRDAVRQGLVSMTGPFWDTVVMCAVTGIATVGSMLENPRYYAGIPADKICFASFAQLPAYGGELLAVSLALFAFATIIGWNVYGVTAVRYLAGEKGVSVYQVCYMLSVYLGAVLSMETVWGLADLFNVLMALPNLLCLFLLQREVLDGVRETNWSAWSCLEGEKRGEKTRKKACADTEKRLRFKMR